MQNAISKTICIFTLAFLIMSVTGAAATTCTPSKANADTFYFSSSNHCGNVLSNDKGTGIKAVSYLKPTNGGKVTMYSNGYFCYTPASSSKTTVDSFTYRIINKCGQYSTAKVTINYKDTPKNPANSQGAETNGASFVTVHPHEGNVYWVGADGHKISLINNNNAVNPTYSQLIAFIKADKTDERSYVPGKYTCGDFAETVHNNAEKAGYRAGWVSIEGINHSCNAFQTTDKGIIYIDCTSSPNGNGYWDSSVKIANGIEYKRVPLFTDNFYFYSMGTVNSYKIYW